MHPGSLNQGTGGLGEAGWRDGQPLADFNGRRFVVHSQEDEVHGAVYLWTELKWLAAQTLSMTRKTTVDR